MKHLYTASFFLVSLGAVAQPQLPGFSAADTLTAPCAQDSTTMIRTYVGWEAYQTVDDRWNGPRDTTICIDLFHVTGQTQSPGISVDQIDAQRPVFLRVRYDDQNVLPLATNNQYAFSFDAYSPGGFAADTCPGGPCTALFGAVRVPDASGTGTVMRQYDSGIDLDPFSQYQLKLCVPTEKFQQNDVREFVVSMKLNNPQPGQMIRYFYSEVMDMAQWGSLVRLTEAVLPNYNAAQFEYGFYWENYLVMHPDTTYPDADHIGYLDFTPVPNVATPSPITVTLEPYAGFNFQPFTQLRGALVLGSDSIRHPLTVVNNGADLCLGWQVVEVFWPPGSQYIHQAGHIEFKGSRSCFMFQPGSTLAIAPNSTFHYGSRGRGMLLLQSGSHVLIGNNAELVMHGTLVIKEAPGVTVAQDMPLTLGPGARLSFAPGARIHNANSIGGSMRLVITLDGGTVDLGGLSAVDRAKVVVVTLPCEALTDLRVLGNPTIGNLALEFASRSEGLLKLRCVDALGQLVLERNIAVSAGDNMLQLAVDGLRAGSYVLEASMGTERRFARFIKE